MNFSNVAINLYIHLTSDDCNYMKRVDIFHTTVNHNIHHWTAILLSLYLIA